MYKEIYKLLTTHRVLIYSTVIIKTVIVVCVCCFASAKN
jgi:hypothetical protein